MSDEIIAAARVSLALQSLDALRGVLKAVSMRPLAFRRIGGTWPKAFSQAEEIVAKADRLEAKARESDRRARRREER